MVRLEKQRSIYDDAKKKFRLKEYQRAFDHFNQLDLAPLNFDDRALILHYMALCKSYAGDLLKSLELFERAKQEDKQHHLIYLNQGLTYYFYASKQDQPQQFIEMALKCFKQSLNKDTSNPEAWYYRGLMHRLLGDKSMAKYSYENVFKLAPKFVNRESCKVYEKMYVQRNLSAK